MASVHPIKPSEVAEKKVIDFPDAVFEAFNQLIAQNFSAGRSVVKQNEVIVLMKKKGLREGEISKNHWLDVEDVYRVAGWKVEYDKPAYCESYDAFFTFKK